MIGSCMKEDSPFGTCLIREGREAGQPATPCETGTLAKITDWHKLSDGMLGILCEGTQRFRILSTSLEPDQLIRATAEILDEEPFAEVPHRHHVLIALLKQVMDAAGSARLDTEKLYDARYIGFQLAEALPLDLSFKQELLECTDPVERLDEIQGSIRLESGPKVNE